MIPTAKLSLLLNALLAFSAVSVYGAPIAMKREVPQGNAGPHPLHRSIFTYLFPAEHSHEKYLTSVRTSLAKNNPDGIVDPVFGLLGNAAASQGLGKITDPDCLQQATADQAFTNAKAAGDVQGQVDALIFRALERNTGKVGLASVACTAIKATNPEIAAISQHQDPASANAAAVNKAITLELAKQIAGVGGDPQQALESGTFAPGDVNDATGKGNSCDDANDPVGCIFTQNLLVEDATAAEIDAAVKGVAVEDATATTTAAADTTTAAADTTTAAATATATDAAAAGDVVTVTVTVTVTDGAAAATSTAAAADTTTAAAADTTAAAATTTTAAAAATSAASSASALDFGSCSNPTIEFGAGFDGRKDNSFRPVNSADFNHGSALNIKDLQNALVRSCDVQHNKCANASNSAGQNKAFSVEDCGNQQTTCNQNATATAASA
ncbi:hypothetical protein M407DRAFT_4239 [Tulasnella calospora MUT 4182]|uniref:Uncharacterized protein n=1 Tax=Tulasnella calospora MUT 4182 TaxID=1051891 RepID=A0A0C3LGE3_9AGAM|nr:hypothetical protein M407DRAFT_4239 [Tulasnella calospora MUT 4182]